MGVTCVPSLPTAPVPVSMVTSSPQTVAVAPPSSMATSIVAAGNHAGHTDDKQKVILSSKLPNHVTLHHHNPQPPSSVVSLIKRSEAVEAAAANANSISIPASGKTVVSSGGQPQQIILTSNGRSHVNGQTAIHIPDLIHIPQGAVNGDSNGLEKYIIASGELIAVTNTANGGNTEHVISVNGNNQVVENEEVMWGSGSLGPAVVVEAADTVPVTYIEASEIVYSASAEDNIDYDYFYPVTTSTSATSNVA